MVSSIMTGPAEGDRISADTTLLRSKNKEEVCTNRDPRYSEESQQGIGLLALFLEDTLASRGGDVYVSKLSLQGVG